MLVYQYCQQFTMICWSKQYNPTNSCIQPHELHIRSQIRINDANTRTLTNKQLISAYYNTYTT
jgi:hypothetical protein